MAWVAWATNLWSPCTLGVPVTFDFQETNLLRWGRRRLGRRGTSRPGCGGPCRRGGIELLDFWAWLVEEI
jgi:hypothetical protein